MKGEGREGKEKDKEKEKDEGNEKGNDFVGLNNLEENGQ